MRGADPPRTIKPMWKLAALVLAGCAAAGATATPRTELLSNASPGPRGSGTLFELGVDSLGPIVPSTLATEEALHELLGARYTVKPIDRSLHVFVGDELLFYVIPNDDHTLFNVHVVSPKIAITEHPGWVIEAPFQGSESLTTCECWGRQPVCFRAGDHVGIAFEIECGGLDSAAGRRALLVGVPIQRAIWSPRPFGAPPAPSMSSPPALSKLFGGDPP